LSLFGFFLSPQQEQALRDPLAQRAGFQPLTDDGWFDADKRIAYDFLMERG
jgi:hypothetical protein